MLAKQSQSRAFALLGLVMLLWAGNSIVARAVHQDVPPFTLAFVRWLGASLVLAPFAIAPLRRDLPALRAGWKEVLLLGLLGVAGFNALLYSGLQYTTATNALLLQAATPALVVILDRLVFKVRSTGLQIAGMAASIGGVVVIVFRGDPAAALGLQLGAGDGIVLASVAIWALYTVLLRLRPDISPVSFIAATFAVGVAAMAPLAVWEWAQGLHIRWSGGVVAAFVYVALLPSLLSYFIYNSATEQIGPARAGQATTLMPLFGAFLSAALLGEVLQSWHFAGMALVLVGIAMGIMALRRENGQRENGQPENGRRETGG